MRKQTSQRSHSTSRYNQSNSKPRVRDDRLDALVTGGAGGENNKVSPRQILGFKSNSPRLQRDNPMQNSKGAIGVRIKSGKKSEDGQFLTANKDENFADRSFEGWGTKK